MGIPQRTEEVADVLIVTAVKDEWDAVLAVHTGATPGSVWEIRTGSAGLTVAFRTFESTSGILRVAVTQALGMGGANAVIASAQLLTDYGIRCLAMCGVCAGRRGDVALGDVIIADRLWEYDTGKVKVEVIDGVRVEREQGDIEMYRLHPPAWKQAAERFEIDRTADWLALRPRSYETQGNWILERVYRGGDPATDPERALKCTNYTEALARLWKKKLLEDGTLRLTADGRNHIERLLVLHGQKLPEPAPHRVHVGPIASGSKVIEDEHIFARLADPVRKVLGVEMEAAAIGALAYTHRLPYSVVMKAVMDHADPDKSDNYKTFAARASAECLIAFLRQQLPTTPLPAWTLRVPLMMMCVGIFAAWFVRPSFNGTIVLDDEWLIDGTVGVNGTNCRATVTRGYFDTSDCEAARFAVLLSPTISIATRRARSNVTCREVGVWRWPLANFIHLQDANGMCDSRVAAPSIVLPWTNRTNRYPTANPPALPDSGPRLPQVPDASIPKDAINTSDQISPTPYLIKQGEFDEWCNGNPLCSPPNQENNAASAYANYVSPRAAQAFCRHKNATVAQCRHIEPILPQLVLRRTDAPHVWCICMSDDSLYLLNTVNHHMSPVRSDSETAAWMTGACAQ